MLTPKEALKLAKAVKAAFVAIELATVADRSRYYSIREKEAELIKAKNAQLKVGHMLIKLTDHTAPARVRKR